MYICSVAPSRSIITISTQVTALHLASTWTGSCLRHLLSIILMTELIPRLINSPTDLNARIVIGMPSTANTMHKIWPRLVDGASLPYPKNYKWNNENFFYWVKILFPDSEVDRESGNNTVQEIGDLENTLPYPPPNSRDFILQTSKYIVNFVCG